MCVLGSNRVSMSQYTGGEGSCSKMTPARKCVCVKVHHSPWYCKYEYAIFQCTLWGTCTVFIQRDSMPQNMAFAFALHSPPHLCMGNDTLKQQVKDRVYFLLFLGCSKFRAGRRPTFMLCVTLSLVSATAVSFMPSFTSFAAVRFFVAAGNYGIFLMAFVIGTIINPFGNQ